MTADAQAPARAARALRALQAGEIELAFNELRPLEDAIEHDREVARAWLELLRASPGRATLAREAQRVLASFPSDAELVTLACDALIRAAERVPPDAPQPSEGHAETARQAAARCLQAAHPPELTAFLHMAEGNALRLLGRHEQALEAMQQALARMPERGGFWFNLGLLHKARRDFREALAANQRARELLGAEKAVLWNTAICAVALGDGVQAIAALRALGHDAKAGASGMPYVDGLPPLQVRVATVGSGLGTLSSLPEAAVGFELLWVTPISPCHGVVSSASYRQASVDYGDVVLWDAVPVGLVVLEGRPVPRMPLLARLRKGDERRFRFVALQQAAGQVQAIVDDLPAGAQLFAHHERVELLCARCASGEHMHKHSHEPPVEHRLVYGKLVVPAGVELAAFRGELDVALRRHPAVRIVMPELLEAIGDSAAAGKAHQLWRGLERVGLAETPEH